MWRSDDPGADAVTVRRIARLAVDWADQNGLEPALVFGDGPFDPNGLIGLLSEVFFLGRACGARAVAHVMEGTEIPAETPSGPYRVERDALGGGLPRRLLS